MPPIKALLACLCLAASLPTGASATIVATFTDQAGLATAVGPLANLSLGIPGAPPVFVATFTSGPMTVSARDGLLAGDGGAILSTALDSDMLILDFASPIFAFGLMGGISDADFAYFDGELDIEAVGSGVTSFAAMGGPAYFGLRSDVAFSQVRIAVRAYDEGTSSIAFATLQDSVDVAAAVPEPAGWAMLLTGFGTIGILARRRRSPSTLRSITA